MRVAATHAITTTASGGAATSHARCDATATPPEGDVSYRNSATPAARIVAAIQPARWIWRPVMIHPRSSDSNSAVERIGSTSTSVPNPSARASNT